MAKGFKKLEVSTAITMRTKWKKKCMERLKRERRQIRQRFKYIFSFSIMLDIERGFLDKHGMLSSQESRTFVNLGVVLNISMNGHEYDRVSFDFFVWSGKYVECLLLEGLLPSLIEGFVTVFLSSGRDSRWLPALEGYLHSINGFSPFIFSKQVCQYRKKTGLESSNGLAPLGYGDLFLWSGAMALLKISPLYQTTDRICYGTGFIASCWEKVAES
ncbi:hypothetical protein NC651_005711 [Populus alba x Populus x berolinensis]|nr:hypothetical protein NC651_005711 [Populus alba x Populus x berolinensis]